MWYTVSWTLPFSHMVVAVGQMISKALPGPQSFTPLFQNRLIKDVSITAEKCFPFISIRVLFCFSDFCLLPSDFAYFVFVSRVLAFALIDIADSVLSYCDLPPVFLSLLPFIFLTANFSRTIRNLISRADKC